MRNFGKLWKWVVPHKWLFGLIIILAAGSTIGIVLSALSITTILNAIIDYNMSEFIQSSLISFALFVSAVVLKYFYDRSVAKLKSNVIYDIRNSVVETVEHTTYNAYQQHTPEEYASVLLTDLEIIAKKILDMLFKIIYNTFSLISSLVGLIYLHISLVITSVVLAIIVFVVPKVFQKSMQRTTSRVSDANSSLLSTATHWLTGFSVLNDVGAKQYISKKLKEPIEAAKQAQFSDEKLGAFVGLVTGLLSVISQISIIVLTGYLALTHQLTPGAILSSGNLSGMIFSPLSVLVVFYSQFQSGFVSLDKIEQIIQQLNSQVQGQNIQLNHASITIETQNVSVHFSDGRSVNLPNIKIDENKNYAIVGPSGVGKSVFLNVLCKNIEQYQGNFYLNGTELSTLTEQSVKQIVAYVPQSTYIFNLSARDNIMLGNLHASVVEYEAAVRAAGLEKVFSSWKDGDATMLGTLHQQVSGGQAQRIGIARALIAKKPLMLFDEVTANLDQATARDIEEEIYQIPECLKLNVTHRLTENNRQLYDELIDFSEVV